jgi:hypothetical protein
VINPNSGRILNSNTIIVHNKTDLDIADDHVIRMDNRDPTSCNTGAGLCPDNGLIRTHSQPSSEIELALEKNSQRRVALQMSRRSVLLFLKYMIKRHTTTAVASAAASLIVVVAPSLPPVVSPMGFDFPKPTRSNWSRDRELDAITAFANADKARASASLIVKLGAEYLEWEGMRVSWRHESSIDPSPAFLYGRQDIITHHR